MPTQKRYRCRYCGIVLPGGLLLSHFSQSHPNEVRAYLDRIQTVD